MRSRIHFTPFLQKHENDFLEFVQADSYQYGAGLVSVASTASIKLGAVSISSVLENC